MTKYLLAACLSTIAALAAVTVWQFKRIEAVREDAAAARRETMTLRVEAAQAKEARAVADAWLEGVNERASEYADLRSGAMKDRDDAPAPAVVIDAIGRLRIRP